MNDWHLEMTKDGKTRTKTGVIPPATFASVWTKHTTEPARVSMSVSQGLDYGTVKVSATVTLNCDQEEDAINKAAELAFRKAMELVQDGWGVLGIPEEGQG